MGLRNCPVDSSHQIPSHLGKCPYCEAQKRRQKTQPAAQSHPRSAASIPTTAAAGVRTSSPARRPVPTRPPTSTPSGAFNSTGPGSASTSKTFGKRVVGSVLVALLAGVFLLIWVGTREISGQVNADTPEAPTSAPVTQAPPEPTRIDLPTTAYECSSRSGIGVYRGNDQTSCPFSENVARAFDRLEQPVTEEITLEGVFSPVTGLTYTLDCSYSTPVRCTGGNNAVIYLFIA